MLPAFPQLSTAFSLEQCATTWTDSGTEVAAGKGSVRYAGHLTLGEFDDRSRRAYLANSDSDLAAVTADLPALRGPRPQRRARRWVVSLLGGTTMSGRWRLSGQLTSVSVMGGSDLDLRQAEIDDTEVTITSICLMGGDDIYVPDGVDVEISGFSLLGGSDQHGSSTGGHPGGPLVRIRVFCLMGGTDVWRVPAETRSTSLADVRRQVKALGR